VKMDLMGLAIGSHGTNIIKARDVPGITSIEVEDETCTIKVFGEVNIVATIERDSNVVRLMLSSRKKQLKKHEVYLNMSKKSLPFHEN
jgi:hypothetical protein